MSERKITIGIDLGTSKCCVGVVRNGKVEILENERGNKTTPSYVAFTDTKRLVGDDAKDQVTFNPANTLNGIKRIIGRDFEETLVTEYWKNVPYEGTVNQNRICVKASYKGHEMLLHPQQVTASLLQKMKKMVEATLQCTVEQAVISVPASFENSQRLATKEAATIAGLEVLALINEPTAAALAYLQNKTREEKEVIAIIDFGGGKLDVSIVAVSKSEIEVLAVSGSQEIGGEFLDELMMQHVMEAILAKFGEEFIPKKNLLAKLRVECETAKKTLSLLPKVSMRIDGVKEDEDFHIDISRETFHRVIIPKLRPVLIRCLDHVFQASGLDKHEISLALLVGGSSRIPVFKVWLKEYFDPSPIYQTVNLDEAVASGAALYAALHGGDNVVHDITIKDILSNTFCMSREVNPNIQHLFPSSKVTIPSAHVMPYCSQSPFNEETKCQTFEIFEEISDRNIHHKLIGTLCLSDEFSRATTLIRDLTFTIDRCGIFDVAVVLDLPQTTFPTIVKDYAGKLKKEQLSRAVHREELFQRDELEDLNLVETYTSFEKCCYDILSEVKNPLYEEKFPELVQSLSVCAAEGLVSVEDMPASTEEVLHRRELLEALYKEFSTKIEKLESETLERTAAVSELSSLCSNINVLLQTDGAWTENSTTFLLMRTEIERITQWLKLTKTPSLIDCDEKKNALQTLFERSVSRLVDNQQIINLRNYCLDLRETLPNNLDYEHCPQLRESLIGEVEDCLGWLDNTKRAFKSECVKRISSLKKNHCELVELYRTNSEAQEQKVGNTALLLRKICLQTRDLVKKCSKLGEMDPQQVENTKKQIMDFLCLVDDREKSSKEEWKDKISEVLVNKVMFESRLRKHEQMILNEEERRATLKECQKSRSAMHSRIVNVFKPKLCCRVMKVADELVKWLETPNAFSKQEYQKRAEQWMTINERVNAEIYERAKKDMEANSAAN